MNEDLKAIAERIKNIKGNVKGDAIVNHVAFIRSREGKEALKAVEKKMKDLGHQIDFTTINRFDWYPAALASFVMIVAREMFNWNDDVIIESGKFGARNSFIMRMFVRVFVSPKNFFEFLPRYWKKQYDFGELNLVELDENKKSATVRIKNYEINKINCLAFLGYGQEMARYATGSESIAINEVKCIYNGDPYHEFKIMW